MYVTKEVRDWAMFTEAGNMAVEALVLSAKERGLNWNQVYTELNKLSQLEGFGEAMDTAVREVVYCAVATEDESFWA